MIVQLFSWPAIGLATGSTGSGGSGKSKISFRSCGGSESACSAIAVGSFGQTHGPINYIDSRHQSKKCRLKNWPVKGLCGRCLSVCPISPPYILFTYMYLFTQGRRWGGRVSDPHWFNADPAFFLIADPDPGFDDLKLKKNIPGKLISIFLDQKLQFTYL